MSLADLASVVLAGFALGYIPLAAKMIETARIRPRIWALTLFTVLVAIVAAYVIAVVAAIANSVAGYPVPRDLVVAILRFLLLPLAGFPYLYVWVRQSGRFRDGMSR